MGRIKFKSNLRSNWERESEWKRIEQRRAEELKDLSSLRAFKATEAYYGIEGLIIIRNCVQEILDRTDSIISILEAIKSSSR